MIPPFIRVVPPALGNRLEEALLVAEALGHELDDEQKLALGDVTSTTGDKLAAYEAVLSAPRQSGKSLVAEVYAVMYALRGESVLYTGHRADLAGRMFRRLVATLPDAWETEATFSNGREQIEFQSGGRILFKTRSQRVGRGESFHKLIIDEAQMVVADDLDGVRYSLRAMPDVQILYAGCAPNGRANINCLVWKRLRDRAQSGRSSGLVYLEWSGIVVDADGDELQAHEMTEDLLCDRSRWRAATPNFGARITEERMEAEWESQREESPESFGIEALNVPIWPDVAYRGTGPITAAPWEALVDEESAIESRDGVQEVIAGFDMNGDRGVPLCVAGRRPDRILTVDYVDTFTGSAAFTALEALLGRDDVYVRAVVCDGSPENLAMLKRLKANGTLAPGQLREEGASRLGQQACGRLVDLVNEQLFRHRGQPELLQAVRGLVTKQVGDGWVPSRSKSRSDVSPLIAAAVALFVADTELPLVEPAPLQIF